MAANRIRRHMPRFNLPEKSVSPATPTALVPPGFSICPPQLCAGNSWQQEIYRQAYERALATTQVPRHLRRSSAWN